MTFNRSDIVKFINVKASKLLYEPIGPWSRRLSPVSVVLSGWESLTPPERDTSSRVQGSLFPIYIQITMCRTIITLNLNRRCRTKQTKRLSECLYTYNWIIKLCTKFTTPRNNVWCLTSMFDPFQRAFICETVQGFVEIFSFKIMFIQC